LQLEALLLGCESRLGNDQAVSTGGERRGTLIDIAEILVCRGREARRECILREGGRLGAEARGVRSRLSAELSEVQVGSRLVAHVHGLVQLALGPVAVEDNAVESDTDNLNDELDNDADQGPVLIRG
jgi:hypothetical protein